MTDLFKRRRDIAICPWTKESHLGKCSNRKLHTLTLVNGGTLKSIGNFASALSNVNNVKISDFDFDLYYGGFLRNGLHKRYRYISKSRWHLLATVYWSRDDDGIGWSNFLLESALECPHVYYAPPLLRERLIL